MKNLKHLFTALLLLCATAATAYDFVKGGIYYNITSTTDFTVEVTYRGSSYYEYSNLYSGNVVIPESVTYNGSTYSVTSIDSYTFRGCSGLTSVVIPNSVTSIGEHAFYDCSGLTSVVIPNSVTSIGSCAFEGCSGLKEVHISDLSAWCGISFGTYSANPLYYAHNLYLNGELVTDLVIPNSVTSIGSSAFYFCSGLISVVIPNSVTSIGEDAFRNCSGLTSVVIPNSVTSIGEDAFRNCSGLKEVHISDLSAWCGIGFGYYANPLYNADNLYLNGELVTDLVIPDGVIEIKDYAFEGCSGLTSVVIPNSVTSIGSSAFDNCSGLISVVIPNSVTSIGDGAFSGCSGLISVVIPNSVTSIGSSAFSGCSGLKEVINFSSLAFSKGSIANGFVAYYAETVINAPNGVIEGDFVFAIIDGVNTLCRYIGAGGDVTLPADYKGDNYVIGADAFYNCSALTSVVIPNSVTSIGYAAFYDCSGLKSVVIPNSVTSIGEHAFDGCSGLTSVVIPNSVTSIGERAFYKCSGLKEVHISDLSAWCGIDFESIFANPLYYAHNLYLNGELVTDLVIPDGVTEIKGYAFYFCSGLTSVAIPNSVTSIGVHAFYGCNGLKKVINFSSLKFSEGSAANGYVAYYAETVINSVEGYYFVFAVIDGVNTLCSYIGVGGDITLPADYKGENYAIGADVFKNNTSLISVVIPNSVTSIGDGAFSGCSGLKEVHISDLSAWCNIAFASADANPLYYAENLYLNDELLTELTIPDSVTEVKNFAFYNCSGLTSIEILDGVTGIGEEAFRGCSDLEYIYISSTIESIGDYAFAECNNIFDIKIGSKKAVAASENVFSSDAYNNACLYVPAGRKDFYAKTSPWSNFVIQETDFTGIDEVKGENGKVKEVYYDLNGRAVERPANGLYIKNGKKVFVK